MNLPIEKGATAIISHRGTIKNGTIAIEDNEIVDFRRLHLTPIYDETATLFIQLKEQN